MSSDGGDFEQHRVSITKHVMVADKNAMTCDRMCGTLTAHAPTAHAETHLPVGSLSEVWAQPWVLVVELGVGGHPNLSPLATEAPEECFVPSS